MSAKVVMNPNAKEAKCFGLVTMSQESEAETAILKLNGYKLHNKEIVTSRVSATSCSRLIASSFHYRLAIFQYFIFSYSFFENYARTDHTSHGFTSVLNPVPMRERLHLNYIFLCLLLIFFL